MRNAADLAWQPRTISPQVARPLIALVFEGLSENEVKRLPPELLRDDTGSKLFERVCAQPEYYLDRAEAGLLRRHGSEIAMLAGPRAAVVEYGAGAGTQGRRLLESLREPYAYVPVDVSTAPLQRARARLRARVPELRILPVCQDYRESVALPQLVTGARRCIAFFPGSAFGQSRPLEAVALLHSIRETLAADAALLVGVDLVKNHAVTGRAYDDAAGAMAAFNLNSLAHLNRELDATFDLDQFAHRARWNGAQQRVELSVVSRRSQSPCVAGIGIALAADEPILTLQAHQHTLDGFTQLARVAGWDVRRRWIDAANLYSLYWLEPDE